MKEQITKLFEFPEHQLQQYPQNKCLVYKEDNVWKDISTQEFINLSNKASRALLKLGVKPNDKIAIIVKNNLPKWHILDIGILQIGAQNVPLYATLSKKDYRYVLNHSDATYCFVSDNDLLEKVNSVKDKTKLKKVFSFENLDTDFDWQSFMKLGEDITLQNKLEEYKKQIQPEDLATIIYTSGTTGTPKGVMLSHKNVVSSIFSMVDRINLKGNHKRVISYLPISHIFERTASYYAILMGFEIHFAESIDDLGDNIKEVKPHFLAVVPRLLEKIFDKIVDKGSTLTGIKKQLFFWSLQLAEKYEFYNKNGSWYQFKLNIARKLIFKKWQEALGGNIEFMFSGSAPLQDRLIRVFTAAGLPVLEGYGMTETAPGVTLNDLRNNGVKIGTVGKPLKDVEVKIAEDGEILVKGDNVMMGYYKEPEKTAETIQNSYIHTGDIGEIDSDGFLRITDRKKEIFKTSGGKYIAPAVLENELKKSRFIEQVMVIGEAKKMPAAIVQVNFDFVKNWAKKHDYIIDDFTSDKKLIKRLEKEIRKANKKFGKWEQVKRFEITPDEWTIEEGHLTPTMKMRRKIILEKYQYLSDKIYNNQ